MESDKKIIDFKNKHMLPLYSDLISLIKHAKNDENRKLMQEFSFAKAQIHKKYVNFLKFLKKFSSNRKKTPNFTNLN